LSHTAPCLLDQEAVHRHVRLFTWTAGDRLRYQVSYTIRIVGRLRSDGVAAAQLLPDALTQVLQQVEAIGDLAGLWRTVALPGHKARIDHG
jgi:hypothetical protein